MTTSYEVCVYIVNDHLAISFSDRTGQILQRPCGDRMKTTQSSCSNCVIITTSTQKLHDACAARAMSLRVPYDYLKSI